MGRGGGEDVYPFISAGFPSWGTSHFPLSVHACVRRSLAPGLTVQILDNRFDTIVQEGVVRPIKGVCGEDEGRGQGRGTQRAGERGLAHQRNVGGEDEG